MRRASLSIASLIALTGCRQVFGIDDPLATGGSGVIDAAKSDGHAIGFDAQAMFMPGLAMHVENGATLWMNDQPPDIAWQATDPTLARAGVWTGSDLTVADLVFDGLIDGHSPFSAWMEGQVLVPQGMEQIQIMAADYAFIAIETVPYTNQFQQVVSSRNGNAQIKSVNPPLPGWLRIRIGFSTTPNTAQFDVMHSGGNAPQIAPFDDTTLRH